MVLRGSGEGEVVDVGERVIFEGRRVCVRRGDGWDLEFRWVYFFDIGREILYFL